MHDHNTLTIDYAPQFRQCLMFARERLLVMRDAESGRGGGSRSPKTVGTSFDALGCRVIIWYVACDALTSDNVKNVRRKDVRFDDDHVVVLIAARPYVVPEHPGTIPPNIILESNFKERKNLQPDDPRWSVETRVEALDIVIGEVDDAITQVDAVIVANGQTPDAVLSLKAKDVTVNHPPV